MSEQNPDDRCDDTMLRLESVIKEAWDKEERPAEVQINQAFKNGAIFGATAATVVYSITLLILKAFSGS